MRKLLFPLALAAALAVGTQPRPARAYMMSEVLPTEGDSVDSSAPKPCGQGRKIDCGSKTTQQCTDWKYQPNFMIGPSGGGVGYTLVCGTWETTVTKLYKD